MREISSNLNELGIKSPRGKDRWGTEALNKLLANEKYTGSVLFQKTFVEDYPSGKQNKNVGQLAQYLLDNNHPAIVSKMTCESALKL